MELTKDKPKRRAGRPPRLSRDQIVRAAAEIVKTPSPDGLTMAKVAKAVGAAPMALYRHFDDRDDLVDATVGAVFSDVSEVIPSSGDTLERVEAWMKAIRERMIAYPGIVYLLGSRTRVSPGWLPAFAALLPALEDAGLKDGDLANVSVWLSRTTIGIISAEFWSPMKTQGEAIMAGVADSPIEDTRLLESFAKNLGPDDEEIFQLHVTQTLASLARLTAK